MTRIAFTFAGREEVMRIEERFMRSALAAGIVDEWHVWDFSRRPSDARWLEASFGDRRILVTAPQDDTYRPLVSAPATEVSLALIASNDAHLLVSSLEGPEVEIVLGAAFNAHSTCDLVPGAKGRAGPQSRSHAAKLDPGGENDVMLCVDDRTLYVALNREMLFALPVGFGEISGVQVRTGRRAAGVWRATGTGGGITLIDSPGRSYDGFRLAYEVYAHSRFSAATFVKLDDDIVFCDVSRLAALVRAVEESRDVALYSANVVNNGVCAHHQQRAGWYPESEFTFAYPPRGDQGALWSSPELCRRLHRSFLLNRERLIGEAVRQGGTTALPPLDRYSINFVCFRYPLLPMMVAAYERSGIHDDEVVMTQILPAMFGIRTFIWNALVVAHLSYHPQGGSADMPDIVEAYAGLGGPG